MMTQLNNSGKWSRAQWDFALKLFIAVALWFVLVQPATMIAASWCAEQLSTDKHEYDALMFALFLLFGGAGLWALRFWVKHGHVLHPEDH